MKKLIILLTNFHKPFIESLTFWQSLIFEKNGYGDLITAEDFFNDMCFFNIYPEEDFFVWYPNLINF